MKTFWLFEKSPKQVFEEFLKTENPKAVFWDIFSDYNLAFPSTEAADTSEDWLIEQQKLIEEILKNELANMTLNRTEVEDIICAIQELAFLEAEQVVDYLPPKSVALAKPIHEKYIVPKALNDSTLQVFLDQLEDALLNSNQTQIAKEDKGNLIQMMRNLTYYTEEKKDEILTNLEAIWQLSANEESDEEDEAFEFKENTSADAIWPELGLAYSQTFYGFDDAGSISYEAQEAKAVLKYQQFIDEVSELLGQEPDVRLLPKQLDLTEDIWEEFVDFAKKLPILFYFENSLTVWNGKDKVLFLTLRKEDKELPYEIVLGGMNMDAYKTFLNAYNQF